METPANRTVGVQLLLWWHTPGHRRLEPLFDDPESPQVPPSDRRKWRLFNACYALAETGYVWRHICKHCGRIPEDHIDAKCLYGPRRWAWLGDEMWNIDET